MTSPETRYKLVIEVDDGYVVEFSAPTPWVFKPAANGDYVLNVSIPEAERLHAGDTGKRVKVGAVPPWMEYHHDSCPCGGAWHMKDSSAR